MSSNDFDGPPYGPAGGRGADEQRPRDNGASYPAPEGWSNGVWRDPAMDSEYETRNQRAVPRNASQPDNGYTYWADGQGWQNQPGAGAPNTPGYPATPAYDPNATSFDNTRGGTGYGAAAAGFGAPAGDPTAVYRGGAPGAGGPGFYGGSGGQPGQGGQGGGRFGLDSISGGISRMTGGINRMTGGFGRGGNGNGGFNLPFGNGGSGGGPKGPHVPRKGDWWRHWSWKKAGIVAGASTALLVLAMFSGYQVELNSTTIPTALQSETAQDSIVYYSDGTTEMGTIGNTNRQDLTLAQMGATDGATSPAVDGNLIDAFLAAEDKSFYSEAGISYTGILRALGHDVVTGGTNLNGGSTITEEYVKNAFGLGDQQTASIKIKEIFIAQKLASAESKQTILDGFLNTVGLGENANGVQAAAETYFGKSAPQLSLAQDAVLASFPQAPSLLPLKSDKSGLEFRWNYVVTHMYSDGFITQAVEQKTLSAGMPSLLTWADPARADTAADINPSNPNEVWEPYLLSQVETELTRVDGLSQSDLDTGGYKIVTTINRTMEQDMYNSVSTTLAGIPNTAGATVSSLPPSVLVGAQLQDSKTGAIIAEYPGKGQNVTTAECDGVCEENTVTQATEQVGSSFKPYVLSTAVSQGMNVMTSTLDTSQYVCIATDGANDDGASSYSVPITQAEYVADNKVHDCVAQGIMGSTPVENDSGEQIGTEIGQQTQNGSINNGAIYYKDNAQNALAVSSNTGFTDLAHKVGTQNIINMAQKFGVNTSATGANATDLVGFKGEVGMALGEASFSVQDQTQMVATINNDGTYNAAHIVQSYQQSGGQYSAQHPKVATDQALQPAQAQDVQYAMEDTTLPFGTAAGSVTYANADQTPGAVISKTGTTTASKSGFFVGATGNYALVVGMFTVDPSAPESLLELGGGGFGGYWPAKIWNTMANTAFPAQPSTTYPATAPAVAGQSPWDLVGPIPATVCTPQQLKNNGGGKHGNKSNQQAAKNCQNQNGNNNTNGQTGNTNNGQPGSTNNPFGNNNGQPGNTNNGSTATNGANTPTPTQTVSCDPTTDVDCTDNNGILSCQVGVDNSCTAVTPTSTATPTTTTNNGNGVFGGAVLLPGTPLLLGFASRKRRREIGRRLKYGERKAE